MPQTDEAQWWFQAVYTAVQQIPIGHATSYGHIAKLLDFPKRARQVGVCLKHLPAFDPSDPQRHFFHNENVPWQRVVNSKGGISPRGDGGLGAARQSDKLRDEGVEVHDGRAGDESWVDLGKWGWFPTHLPGEETTAGAIMDLEELYRVDEASVVATSSQQRKQADNLRALRRSDVRAWLVVWIQVLDSLGDQAGGVVRKLAASDEAASHRPLYGTHEK